MRVTGYSTIRGEKWYVVNPCSGDDDLVSRVTVKFTWQLGGLNDDWNCKIQELDAGLR